jgi:hypothetical protein
LSGALLEKDSLVEINKCALFSTISSIASTTSTETISQYDLNTPEIVYNQRQLVETQPKILGNNVALNGLELDVTTVAEITFSNVKSENDISITQFRDESRRLHHM